jgi:phosphoglucosamine mutase
VVASGSRPRFGTDGVRGRADTALADDYVVALGRAAARVLGRERWLIGRDTRESGPRIEAALADGLTREGADVSLLGVVPTPAVALASREAGAPAAAISASHNPFADNGIKLFAAGGRKLADDVQGQIEALLDGTFDPAVAAVGSVGDASSQVDRYVEWLISTMEGRRLDGVALVIDAANGAAHAVGPRVLEALGASVLKLHVDPDGRNINARCGSQHPEALREAVLTSGADLGLALDGDADRVIAVDAAGEVVDGDQIMAMCAVDMKATGHLTDDTIVVTVMSNLGLRLAMADAGVAIEETPVGDRYVLEVLDRRGLSLGGEQSGHVIFHDLIATGDGLLTGLRVLDLMHRSGRSLADLASTMRRFPQVLVNVPVDGVADVEARIAADVAEIEHRLGSSGRVLIRASGTEPLVRVMVEAPSAEEATELADHLARAVARTAGR